VKTYLLTIYWIGISAFAPATVCGSNLAEDSVADSSRAKVATTRFTSRINSMGMFNYGGRIVSSNPSVDFMYVREGRHLSVQAFKAFDLYNVHTDMNFTAVFLYKNFGAGKRLVVAPCVGFVAPQLHSIADKGSDLAARVVSSYKLSPELTLEHTAIVTNLVLKTDDLDWVNRFRLTYSKKSFDATVTVWHNNKVFDTAAYFTTSLSLAYARVRVSDHVLLNTSITSVIMPYSDNRELNPKKNGLIMTVAAVVHY
jgi:hypothetical protein